jgi:hypothetical protein
MGIFFGEQIYGIRYSDMSGDDYVTVYERKPDLGFAVDKSSIRKILLDESRRPACENRVFEIYTFYITTHSDDSITKKSYIWRTVSRQQLADYGTR